MEKYSFNLPEKNFHRLGDDTTHLVVTADESDDRAWLSNRQVCPIFKQHHITHVGIMWAKHPLEIVRASQDGSYFMACIKGKGEAIIDGSWKTIKEGEACLQPPLTVNALRCIEGEDWEFCWVRYNELHHRMPISSFLSPVRAKFNHQTHPRRHQGALRRVPRRCPTRPAQPLDRTHPPLRHAVHQA